MILGEHRARRVGQAADDPVLPADDPDRAGRLGRPVGSAFAARRSRRCGRVLKVFNQPKPTEPPSWYPARGWPLWFVGFAFRHTRLAGGLLTLGLLINCILPVKLPLPWL